METISKKRKIWIFIICILICESVGIISGLLANAAGNDWFKSIVKPSWNPPSYLFAPVWTALYLLMGVSLGLVWTSKVAGQDNRKAYFFFGSQLFLNFWWSILFFKFHSPAIALIDIILMVLTIAFTIFYFSKISRSAAWLLVPYFAWVSFATVLNFAIWNLNK